MSSKLRKTRRKKVDLFDGKRDPGTSLLRAVKRYVESKGGSILVIGGIEVQKYLSEGEFKYRVAVRCMGRSPVQQGAAVTQEVKQP